MPYLVPWIVLVAAGLGVLLGVYALTRPLTSAFLKRLLRCLAMVWLLLPAPVPGYAGHFAPAFVVALFEALFQQDGQPTVALAILGAGTLVVVLLLGLLALRQRTTAPAAAAADLEGSQVAN